MKKEMDGLFQNSKRSIARNSTVSFWASVWILPLLFSCNKEEQIPSYIHIDKIDVNTVYASQGSNSHKIIDAWIYIDDQFVGAYEMPCTVPVLYNGTHTVKVFPGVKENGISETRIPYSFYNTYEQTITLTSGKIATLDLITTYSQKAVFSWIADFESSATGICNSKGSSDSIMKITTTASDVFELKGSGSVVLSGSPTSYFGISCDKFVLPQAGSPVFLELDYKCNTDFNIGIVGYAGTNIEYQGVSLTLRPTSGWNKVYVNLTNEVTASTTSTKFAIFFSMLKNPDLSSSYFYLDNVKLIN